MHPLIREDTKQVLADQLLVERLPDGHWARPTLLILIFFGVYRIAFYRKWRFVTSAQYIEILKEAEAPYAAERPTTTRDKGLPDDERECRVRPRWTPRIVRDQVEGVPEPRPGVLV